ncbi:MAG: hypothetical protein P1P88_19515 [Bacteroidales bacterium]|nr:hypothetical protein [Bacteroidales bacterium]
MKKSKKLILAVLIIVNIGLVIVTIISYNNSNNFRDILFGGIVVIATMLTAIPLNKRFQN